MASLDNLSSKERCLPRRQKNKFSPHYYHSTTFFSKVCIELGRLNEGQLIHALKLLKNTESGEQTQVGEPYIFSDDDLFNTLLQMGCFKYIYLEHGFENWQDIILHFQ